MVTSLVTKEFIKLKMLNDERWLMRGILAIYNKQTEDEKYVHATLVSNGVGFNVIDAKYFSRLIRLVELQGCLTRGQTVVARQKMVKYAGQLEKITRGVI